MSEGFEVQQLSPVSAVSSSREGSKVQLIVLHSNPQPATQAIAATTAADAVAAPHYYVTADGTIYQLVAEARAAQHSGLATWKSRRRNIDRISIGITVEHTPGAAYNPACLPALNWLIAQVSARYALAADALLHWQPDHQGGVTRRGTLVPMTLPPPEQHADELLGGAEEVTPGTDTEVTCVPPPPPPPTPLPGDIFGGTDDPHVQLRIWIFLSNETYRQRGEGFQSNWAFHRYAPKNNLGAPLSRSSDANNQVSFGAVTYGFQVFARDTIFNPIPQWTAVQSLNSQLQGQIPSGGPTRALLEASFASTGNVLNADWAFHQRAVADSLGAPLSGSYTITIDGQDVNIQVFAGDLLYCFPPAWGDVRRLSQTEAGSLREALWAEAYKPSGAPYDAASAFQQQAVAMQIGMPLTGAYQADFEGNIYTIQVFAYDTLYAQPNGEITRLSALPKPDYVNNFEPTPAVPGDINDPGNDINPDDALSTRRPTFLMLPLAGTPRISQFFGYTKWAAGGGRQFYTMTQGRHSGIDFAVPVGTALLAIGYGVVVCAALSGGCPFGASQPGSIVVRYGSIYALYGHAQAVRVVRGQFVKPGDVLGLSGEFGGPHLHFELRIVPASILGSRDPVQPPINPGTAFNPVPYFSADLQPYFQNQLAQLGSEAFCVGSFGDQEDIRFGAPPDNRPCTN